jgi:hypothetical protein
MPTSKSAIPGSSSNRPVRSTSKAVQPIVFISESGPSNPLPSSSQTPNIPSSKIPKEQPSTNHQDTASSSDLSSVKSVSEEAEQPLESQLETLKYHLL